MRGFASGAIALVVLLAGFYALDSLVLRRVKLSNEVFLQPSALWAALQQPAFRELFWITLPIVVFRFRHTSWKALDAPRLRLFIAIPTTLLAFAFSAYDFNHYAAQLHLGDRLLLLAMGLASWAHPGFVGPTAIVAGLMARQFGAPMGGYTWTDKRLLFDVLLLFHVYLSLFGVKKHKPYAFYAMVMVLIGGSYIVPAMTKLELGWHRQDELWNLFIGAYTNDWMLWLSPEAALKVASVLKSVTPLLVAVTLVSELAPFLLLLDRKVAIAALLGCVTLHVGIFFASGIFFWKWIVLDLVLAFVLHKMDLSDAKRLFGLRNPYLWLSIPLMYTINSFTFVTKLGWIDTELHTTYHFEAVGESGHTYPLSRSFFSPFDINFAQNRFRYISKVRNIPMTYGVHTNLALGKAVNDAKTAEDIAEVEREYGRVTFDASKRKRFDEFIRRYVRSVNAEGAKREPLGSWFGAPHHIWNSRKPNDYWGQEPVTEVRVRMRKQFYRADAHLDTLMDEVVHTVVIEPETAQAKPRPPRRNARPPSAATASPRPKTPRR